MAECVATPYGVYDLANNKGWVIVGTSKSTPAFAVTSIRKWWQDAGCNLYPNAAKLLILADGGGSNGYRSRAWKKHLQGQLCDRFGLSVTVCHYPPRCSKFNPIERRLFSFISLNWAGRPLKTVDMMLACIRGTTTRNGLTVEAFLSEEIFEMGEKTSRKEMEGFDLRPHTVNPDWNYDIEPREDVTVGE